MAARVAAAPPEGGPSASCAAAFLAAPAEIPVDLNPLEQPWVLSIKGGEALLAHLAGGRGARSAAVSLPLS